MANKIQVRRGNKTNLPVLSSGEPGLALDTKELFFGSPDGNIGIATSAQLADMATIGNYMTGMEYLVYYHEKLRTEQAVKLIFSGDSTTYGASITDPDYILSNASKILLNKFGVTNVTTVNAGHNNMNVQQWIDYYIAEDMPQNPDLYVLRWGLNHVIEPFEDRVEIFETNLRAGLATVRAARDVNNLSIILMMPNSSNDPVNDRYAPWYELIYPVIKKAARDFHCCFIDTYHYLLDSTNPTWEDGGDGGIHIHPLEIGNAWIINLMSEVLIPTQMRNYGVTNSLSNDITKSATDHPNTYEKGVSLHRAGTGFPYNGFATTMHNENGMLTQINSSFQDLATLGTEGLAFRRGVSYFIPGGLDGWGDWIYLRNSEAYKPLTLLASWVNKGGGVATAAYLKDGAGNTHIKGSVKDGTTTIGSVVANIPVGYRPLEEFEVNVTDGGRVRINPDGNIMIISMPVSYFDFGRIIFVAEQ